MTGDATRRRGEAGIFVPAIMGAGLLVSLVVLMEDALHRGRWHADRRRTVMTTATATADLRTGALPVAALRGWRRTRLVEAIVGAVLVVAGGLLLYGATANHLRPHGYLSDIVWLWALSVLVSGTILVVGLVACALALFSTPPVVTRPFLLRTPLARRPDSVAPTPSVTVVGRGAVAALVMFAAIGLVVRFAPGVVSGSDVRFSDIVADWSVPAWLGDIAGQVTVGGFLVLAVVAVASGFRCIVFAATYLVAAAAAVLAPFVVQEIVGRDVPLGVALTGHTTFPSGDMTAAVVLAGLFPVTLFVLTRRRWPAVVVGGALAVVALAVAIDAVHTRAAWPTDVIAGALLGLAIVLGAHWALGHTVWHAPCRSCPFAGDARGRRHAGLLVLGEEWSGVLRRVAFAWTVIVVALLGVLAWRNGPPEDPTGAMLMPQISGPVQLALLTLMLVAALVARRWPGVGAPVLALCGVALAALALVEYTPIVTVVVALAVLVPAVAFWLGWQDQARTLRIWVVALVTISLLTVGYAGAATLYDDLYGPTHPSSSLPLLAVDKVQWAWSGNMTPTSATVVARTDLGTHRAHLELTPDTGGPTTESVHVDVPSDRIVRLHVDGLTPATTYRWAVTVDGEVDESRGHGELRTPAVGPESFRFVAGSCAYTGSNGQVWDTMRSFQPDLVLLTGDVHYQNIADNDVNAFLDAYDRVLTQPAPSALLRSAPVAYLWDDHDYGPNDADASSPSRPAAIEAYQRSVPHAPLAPVGPAAQAFTIGRVRFVITDERAYRTDRSMLGRAQLEWFLEELRESSRTHALVIWVSSDPWIQGASPNTDGWGRYPEERRLIADEIARDGIRNLMMIAGDAHMVAIDDGTNSDYATNGGGGFPVFQASALDRPGSAKGGPYSEGEFPGGGQFGLVDVQDDGTTVTVELTGYDWQRTALVSYRFTVGPRASG